MIVILDFMVTDLRLRGDHLLVFAIIYGFTQIPNSMWQLNYDYISKFLGLNETTIDGILDDLCDKDYIKFVNPGAICLTLDNEE
jgi:hypothetical protein